MKKEHVPGFILFLIGFLLVVGNVAYAGNPHHEHIVYETSNYYSSETVINETVNESDAVLGFAAAQCHLTQSHHLLQWCVGAANYQNENAINLEIGQKFKNTLVNISIGVKEGDISFKDAAIGIGASGTF